jgi:hypothetical protein
LDVPELSKAASIAHVFPGMANHSLLSVGQICNEGYYVTFSIDAVTIYSAAVKSMLKGSRDFTVSVAKKIYELHNTGALVN